jgi:hypothetical protein
LTPTFKKSEWTEDYCSDIKNVQQSATFCIYWAIYDNPQAVALLETSREGVPKEAGQCPGETTDYLDVSVAQ